MRDPRAMLLAAVLMRNQLRTIAGHLGGGDDADRPARSARPVVDPPPLDEPDPSTRAAELLEDARDFGVITALDHKTLTALTGTTNPATAAHNLHASTI
jgi:hypothetical protein